MLYALLLAVVGRLDDAAARVADAIEQARREGNAMALDIWATIDGIVHVAAGRLSAARAATESLPPPQRTAVTERDMIRIVILAEVAVRTDDRNLLQQMVNDARDAYPTGSSVVRWVAAHVLALAAWQRGDVQDAMRWLGGVDLFGSPFWPQVLYQVILGARVASAAGDAGLRARVLQTIDLLERERPALPLFTGVAGYARGTLERDAQALVAAADVLHSSSRPLLYAAAAEDAGAELAHIDRDKAVDQLNAAFDTYLQHEALADARRVGRELRRLGVQRRIVSHPRAKTGWDSLTDSELKVVNLIAQGVTNRSVATQLHLSPHTVKAHLHNAFAKLGINSRVELTQLVRGADHHAN
jgi:DNA-binding CsgD family transcriptional regulator